MKQSLDSSYIGSQSCDLQAATYPNANCSQPDDIVSVVMKWLASFNEAIHTNNFSLLHGLFFQESYWRDQLTLSWNFHTLQGPENIVSFLERQPRASKLAPLVLDDSKAHRKPKWTTVDHYGKVMCVLSFLIFETDIGTGNGVVKLVQDADDGIWKAFTLFTAMLDLKGYEQTTKHRRSLGMRDGVSGKRGAVSGAVDARDDFHGDKQPTVIIVGKDAKNCLRPFRSSSYVQTDMRYLGAGHCGLFSAARLQQLQIPSLIIDVKKRVGDNWRDRYQNLVLHDPVWCKAYSISISFRSDSPY